MAERYSADTPRVAADGGNQRATPPAPINHLGLTVPDIEAAIEFYTEVLGFTVISEPAEVPPDSGHFADLFVDIINEYDGVRQAHLESANGVGFELFEYAGSDELENARPDLEENWQAAPGIHHFAVTHPNIEELIERVEEAGGDQHSAHWTLIPDQPYELVYLVDPWGNMWEVFNRSYAQFFSNQ